MADARPDQNIPLNVLLKSKISNQQIKIIPRRYQRELFEQALRQNVIIYLGTGLGKTFITVLYLNHPDQFRAIRDGKRAVFLAPTQDLVKQQATYLNAQVPYRVKIFCGRTAHCGEHIDKWDAAIWREELEKVDILFVTPQILVNATSTNLLSWSQFCVIFFDECHHASRSKQKSNSPYCQLLAHHANYYRYWPDQYRPRLIGLTASLINSMPKDREAIRTQIRNMEKDFEAKCITDIKVQEDKPRMVIHSFSQFGVDYDALSGIMREMIDIMEAALKLREAEKAKGRISLSHSQEKVLSFLNRLRLAASGFSIKPSSFPKVMQGILIIHHRCGLWAVKTICELLIEALKKHTTSTFVQAQIRPMYRTFGEILLCIHSAISSFFDRDPSHETRFVRSKTSALLDILVEEYERSRKDLSEAFSCIIFVRSRLEVVALNKWIQHVSKSYDKYKFIKCDYAIGLAATMASKYACITKRKSSEQSKMLNDFRESRLNVIVTTSVLEEGIDLPRCSTVIRYDMPNNFREYVQARGRARQRISTYYLMCESDRVKETEDSMNKFNDFEITLKKLMSDPNHNDPPRPTAHLIRDPEEENYGKEDVFVANENRIQMMGPMAKTILHMYCSRLAKGNPFSGNIQHESVTVRPGLFQTKLFLPSGCPLESPVWGNIKNDPKMADNSAAVVVVRMLFEKGELNEHAVPVAASEEAIDELIDQTGISPKIEPLGDELEGKKIADDPCIYFRPKLLDINTNLMRDCNIRRYGLIKVRFCPDPVDSRTETRHYFQRPAFGLIVDQEVDLKSLPKLLFSHYGKLNVQYELITKEFEINRPQEHVKYLRYMEIMLKHCLSIERFDRQKFNKSCLSYVVPLNASGSRPDDSQMNMGFRFSSRPISQVGQIVKMSRIFSQQRGRDRLMLVKRIRTDLTPRSYIPNTRRTFIENAIEKYGRDIGASISPNQRIIEVITLSSAFSDLRELKRVRDTEYCSSSVYYLEQFLDTLDVDPSTVFQAYSMPAIVHRLYLLHLGSELEREFLDNVRKRQPRELERRDQADPQSMDVDVLMAALDAEDEDKDESSEMAAKNEGSEGGEPYDSESEETDDDDDLTSQSDDESDAQSVECDQLNSNEEKSLYAQMVARQDFDLNNDDTSALDKWDMREYKAANMEKLNFVHSNSPSTDSYQPNETYRLICQALRLQLIPLAKDLANRLTEFEFQAIGDKWDLKEDEELSKRTAKVNRDLVPPINFDQFDIPMVEKCSTDLGILEALTLRSAEERHSLELLENLGDSFLKYIISIVLFKTLDGNQGVLTSARSRLVRNDQLTFLAKRKKLGSYAIRKSFTKDEFAALMNMPRDPSNFKSYFSRLRSKDLADIFEAIVGYYLASEGQYSSIMAVNWLGLNIIRDDVFLTLENKSPVMTPCPTSFVENPSPELKSHGEACAQRLTRFEDIIGYSFKDKSHLIRAFTHPSWITKCTDSYERLEFLGDALIDYMVTVTLINSEIDRTPGQVTHSRSSLVNNYAFAKLALEYKYDLYICYFNHELYDDLARVRMSLDDDPEASFIEIIDFDGISKVLADVFESVAAAIYIDSGCSLNTVWQVYYPMMLKSLRQEIECPTRNPISRLFELFPGKDRITFESSQEQAGESLRHRVKCSIEGYRFFEAIGTNNRQAKLRAVIEALENLPTVEEKARLDREYKAAHEKPRARPSGRGRQHPGHRPGSRFSGNRGSQRRRDW